jgi:hypothetical protein
MCRGVMQLDCVLTATVDLAAGYDLSSPGRSRVRFVRHDDFACNELTIERN